MQDEKDKIDLCVAAVRKARINMLEKHPFIAALAFHLEIMPRIGYPCVAGTDGKYIYVEPDEFLELSPDEQMGIVAHEVWHCAMRHLQRRKDRDLDRFNYAADIETDLILTADGFVIEMLPYQEDWVGKSAEWIYEQITPELAQLGGQDEHQYPPPKNASKLPAPTTDEDEQGDDAASKQASQKGNQSEPYIKKSGDNQDGQDGKDGQKPNTSGSMTGKGGDDGKITQGSDGNGGNDSGSGQELDWEAIVRDAAEKCRKHGTLPGYFEAFVTKPDTHESQNWKELLEAFVTMFLKGERSWLPPNRRFVHSGLYLPGRKREQRLQVVVAIDTSGSTMEDLPDFLSELNALCGSFGDFSVTVIQCDACIVGVKTYDNDHPLDVSSVRFRGMGGTSLCPPFDYVREHSDLEPQVFLYFTDGYGDAPQQEPPYPVIWCITKDGEKPAPWGLEIKLK